MTSPMTELILSAQPEVYPASTPIPSDHSRCRVTPPRLGGRDRDFWSKVLQTECCWLWTRATVAGYGVVWTPVANLRAHRVAYELAVGPIPEKRDILHRCDVPRCVRPDHLMVGTPQENSRDMVRKGRAPRQDGERNHHARLTDVEVAMIRALATHGFRQADIAAVFGTSQVHVSRIVSGRMRATREESAA